MRPKDLSPMHLAPTRGEPGIQRQGWVGQGPQGPAGTIIGAAAAASDRKIGKGATPDPEPLDVQRNLVPQLLSVHTWHFKEELGGGGRVCTALKYKNPTF